MIELLEIANYFLSTGYLLAAIWQYVSNKNWHFQAFMALFFITAAQQ
jgi:hypothetical protein